MLTPSDNFDSDKDSIKEFLDEFAATTQDLINNDRDPNRHSNQHSYHNIPHQNLHNDHGTELSNEIPYSYQCTLLSDTQSQEEVDQVDNLSETPTILASDDDSDTNNLEDSPEAVRHSFSPSIPSDSMQYTLSSADSEGDSG